MPLVNVTREEALQGAAYQGGDTYGVVPLRKGSWGIRVLSGAYEDAAKLIQNMLDYMYAIDDKLLVLRNESAVGLRQLSQFFAIRALAKRVKFCINEESFFR